MLLFSRKALTADMSRVGKMNRLRTPTVVVISIIVVATIIMGVLRLVGYQPQDDSTSIPDSTLVDASNLVDIVVVVIMTIFVIMMFIVGVWFLVFLSKQRGITVKATIIKVSPCLMSLRN